jgi:unsaturated rhamnogalacturonyl hydrolase
MANDSAKCDLEHFNKLSSVFGIRFTNKNLNLVKNDEFETGAVSFLGMRTYSAHDPGPDTIFVKELSVLDVKSPAIIYTNKGQNPIIAISKMGRGLVFAIGDPWLYNEYVDGRKLPAKYKNYTVATGLVKWLLKQSTIK